MESTIIKYVSVGNPFSLGSKTLKRRKVLFFKEIQALLHSLIHLIWPSCREHVPKRHRLGLLANWDDLTREICTGERVWLSLLYWKETKHLHAHYQL